MNNAERGVERAIRVTPRSERARWEPEWRGDLAHALDIGPEAAQEVAKGAQRVARRLRLRQLEEPFTGARGLSIAVSCWVGVLLVGVSAFLFGGPALVIFVGLIGGLAAVLAMAGSPSHWSHWLMVASAAVWLACAAFLWWAFGATLDAADSLTLAPTAVRLSGPAFILGAIAFVGMFSSVAIAVARARHR